MLCVPFVRPIMCFLFFEIACSQFFDSLMQPWKHLCEFCNRWKSDFFRLAGWFSTLSSWTFLAFIQLLCSKLIASKLIFFTAYSSRPWSRRMATKSLGARVHWPASRSLPSFKQVYQRQRHNSRRSYSHGSHAPPRHVGPCRNPSLPSHNFGLRENLSF